MLCTRPNSCTTQAAHRRWRIRLSDRWLRFRMMFRAFLFHTDAGAYWSVVDGDTYKTGRSPTRSCSTFGSAAAEPNRHRASTPRLWPCTSATAACAARSGPIRTWPPFRCGCKWLHLHAARHPCGSISLTRRDRRAATTTSIWSAMSAVQS